MKIAAYVLNKNGNPLNPMHSYRKVKRFLRENKAKIVCYKPFTIKLTYEIDSPIVKEYVLGMDTGRTNIGISVIDKKGNVYYGSEIETSNKSVPKHMLERKEHRKARRQGERKVRQRKAKANGTIFKESEIRERFLPKCKEAMKNKYIKNSEAKFANRKREEGWLTPTANHLLNTHIRGIELVCKILPIKEIVVEITRWDFAKMENPKIKNWEYQKGKLFGFDSLKDAVSSRQNGICLLCKSKIEHYHHIIPRHKNGSNTLNNLCGLCIDCHKKVHKETKYKEELERKQIGLLKKYHALSVMNQIMPNLLKKITEIYKEKEIKVTTGIETERIRKSLNLEKEHWIDAYCIGLSVLKEIEEVLDREEIEKEIKKYKIYRIKQFRRQNREIINNQRERTYRLNGQIVAKNRKKRFEQEKDSLEDWFKKMLELYRVKEAEKLRSILKMEKSVRRYNRKGREMPGSIFIYQGKRYVLSGQLSNGMYYRGINEGIRNFKASECRIVRRNTGLVYI